MVNPCSRRRSPTTCSSERPSKKAAALRLWREPLGDHRLEHRLHFARGPGEQQKSRGPLLDPQPWRRAVRIRKYSSAARHHRLTPVDLGHGHAAASKALTEPLDDRFIDIERDPEDARDRIAGHVVLSRTEPAGDDDE